ncbi:uncharacterized protein LOC141822309 [Curcuma longa]|uniref:uncharacterized protein LOC141822309 n=1 Tax=Curcuma longa TaxID=136217 RepID=UPI003D9E04A8
MEFTGILLLQIILLISLKGFSSWPMDALPSNCSKTCGDIKIEYPFGIDTNCSYGVGFNLTCSQDSDPPRLLLGDGNIQVRTFDMKEGRVIIESPYVTLNVDAQSNNTALINLKNLPLSFNLHSTDFGRSYRNRLHVAGGSAIAIVVDLDTNSAIDACTTICSTINTSTTEQQYMWSKNEYCHIDLDSVRFSNRSLAIQLRRLEENMDHIIINSTSSIIATLYDPYFVTDYDDLPRFIDHKNTTGMMASLAWYFNDYSTCKEAMKRTDTYACRSDRSECYDVLFEDAEYLNEPIGYNCRCSSNYVGNPYLPDGCQLDKNFTSTPAKDCQPKCGNVTISFPFGLKQGCYRDEGFALTCNETSNPPTLLFGGSVVSNISLKKGQLEYNNSINYYSYNSRRSHFTSLEDGRIMNWVIGSQSCKGAAKDNTTFACIYENSSCLDVKNDGYRCICKDGYDGNPYLPLPDGCRDIDECNSSSKVCTGNCVNKEGGYSCICPPGTSGDPFHGECLSNMTDALDMEVTSTPAEDCPTECGNITISFPFGLKRGCYRDTNFALTCNETSHPATLLFQDKYVVSKISLKEGQLEFIDTSHYEGMPTNYVTFLNEQRIIIKWVIDNQSCDDAKKNNATFACIDKHSTCLDVSEIENSPGGYRCKCSDGYDGNPYLPDGCQVRPGDSINTEGGHKSICPDGTSGACLIPHKRNYLLLGTVILAALFAIIIYVGKKWKHKNQRKIRQKNFHRS